MDKIVSKAKEATKGGTDANKKYKKESIRVCMVRTHGRGP
jgi:hypothetical protein